MPSLKACVRAYCKWVDWLSNKSCTPCKHSSAAIWPRLFIRIAIASVLPPAPAHQSATRIPARASATRAISWLPSSWISTAPDWKAGPVVTDQGFLIVDAKFAAIPDPALLEPVINNIPGVVTNGLFAMRAADVVLVGKGSEVISY